METYHTCLDTLVSLVYTLELEFSRSRVDLKITAGLDGWVICLFFSFFVCVFLKKYH